MWAQHPCIDCGTMVRITSKRCRACNGQHQSGKNNPAWKGGVSKDNMRYKRAQQERYPERLRARLKVYQAMRSGHLVREHCQWPGCNVGPEKTQAHHWSYEPGHELDVTCFCRCHHRLVDRMTREQFEFIRAAATPRTVPKPTGAQWLAILLDPRRAISDCKER